MARPSGLVTPLGVYLSPFAPHYPHPPQEAFLALDSEEALYGGAARGGKSDALLMAALQFVEIPGYAAMIFRRISPDLHGADGLVPRSKEWLTPVLGDRAWSGDRLSWTFPSGATLRFGHMQYEDDVFKFQGHAYQFIGFDELTHFTERQYRYMFSRMSKPADGPLAQVPLRMRSSSNPGGPGHRWVKRRFIDRLHDPDDPQDSPERALRRVFIPARVDDNPSIDRAAYRRQLAHLEPEVRAQLLNGDWNARRPGNWFFEDGHLDACEAIGAQYDAAMADGELKPYGSLVDLGVDWGDHTHALLLWPLEGGGVYVADEFVGVGGEPIEHTPLILAMNRQGHPWGHARHDAAGKLSISSFHVVANRMLGDPQLGGSAPSCTRVAFSKFKGISALHLRRLARRSAEGLPGHLAISRGCQELRRQLRMLQAEPESAQGDWKKADDQHGPDGLIAGCAPAAKKQREAVGTTNGRHASHGALRQRGAVG